MWFGDGEPSSAMEIVSTVLGVKWSYGYLDDAGETEKAGDRHRVWSVGQQGF